jgi:hypothetical protein
MQATTMLFFAFEDDMSPLLSLAGLASRGGGNIRASRGE